MRPISLKKSSRDRATDRPKSAVPVSESHCESQIHRAAICDIRHPLELQNGPSTDRYHMTVSRAQAHYSSMVEENNRLAVDNFHWIEVFEPGIDTTNSLWKRTYSGTSLHPWDQHKCLLNRG